MPPAICQRDPFVMRGSGWQIKVLPPALTYQSSCQILRVQPLHDEHNDTIDLAVQARQQRRSVIVVHPIPRWARKRFLRFQRIIDDDKITAPTRHGSADGDRDTSASTACLEFAFSIPRSACRRENTAVPRAVHHLSEASGKLGPEFLGVA